MDRHCRSRVQLTTIELHLKLRNVVIIAVADRHVVMKKVLGNDDMVETLHANADLATDLLLARPIKVHDFEYIFMCDSCEYVHVGSDNCFYIENVSGSPLRRTCPDCRRHHLRATSKK